VRRAILARHGESEYSVRGALNGDVGAVCGLTEEGRDQARRLGEALRDEPIDLCVVTEFQRVRETADAALAGRDVPRLVVPELNDPRFGRFEGCHIDEYRAWAESVASSEPPSEDSEARHAIVERYARGFRILLARPEDTLLLVAHSLPLAYVFGARDGADPGALMPLVLYAEPYELVADELECAVERLEAWIAAPTW
jgi:broad specificity phosphatase PhoE